MLEIYIFETAQNIEQMEQAILSSEKDGFFTTEDINLIFRLMHSIKGSSAMMQYDNLASLAHSVEDLFFYIRENSSQDFEFSVLSDMLLESIDFMKVEIEKIKNGDPADGNSSELQEQITEFLNYIKRNTGAEKERASEPEEESKIETSIAKKYKNAFKITFFFDEGCEMENIRAFGVVHKLGELSDDLKYFPEDIIDNENSKLIIREKGFLILLKTDKSYDEINNFFSDVAFLKDLNICRLENEEEYHEAIQDKNSPKEEPAAENTSKMQTGERPQGGNSQSGKEMMSHVAQSIISVNVSKLDMLMDLVGEMVIAEAMVTQNPDLRGLKLDNFQKSSQQLRKIIGEIQQVVMSVRMIPLATTFQRMNRIVRDMCQKLDKKVQLEISGEETEVDKNIVENIADPLIHLVRNAVDHGIESEEEREEKGKPAVGTIQLEAKNDGGDVVIIVRDDGKGLDRGKILSRAKANGLLVKPESEMTDKEIYSLIFLPGFSTKGDVSEFSGRGVGMDIVVKNIEKIGGTVSIDSAPGKGSSIVIKIPLTLAIISGMIIKVGDSCYTMPIKSIKESFRPSEKDIIRDPDLNEMIMVRGNCYPIIRLHEIFKVEPRSTNLSDGIIMIIENGEKAACVFVDELIGEQQVVVKELPKYIKRIKGIAGCTLLGDGSISLIIDVGTLIC